jgi:hypothetical protein
MAQNSTGVSKAADTKRGGSGYGKTKKKVVKKK